MTNDSIVWHAAASDRLRSQSLDSLTALFDRASGQTHLVAAPSPEILAELADAPATAAALVERLASRFELTADGNALAVIEARLAELAALGLVEAR